MEISKLFSNILFHLGCWLAGWILSYIVCFCPILKLIFLDQRRQMSARDGCICCFVHKNFKPDQSNKPAVLSKLFGKVGLLLTNTCVQLSVLLVTLVFLAIGIWGTMSLTQVCTSGSLTRIKLLGFIFLGVPARMASPSRFRSCQMV